MTNVKVKFGKPGLRMGHLTIEFAEVQYAPLDEKEDNVSERDSRIRLSPEE